MTNADRQARLILSLRQQGVTDPRVLKAMESIDRAVFVHERFLDQAWEDQALPIDCAQTISQPYVVGLMTQALDVKPRHRVLEIGTGSGYQCAVLSRLARYVYSVERYKSLLKEAEGKLKTLRIDNVITRHGDGGLGWPEQAPFDRIMVTAAAPGEPTELLHQLKPGEKHDHLRETGKAENRQEALVDEAVEESFPASDPASPKHIT